MSVKLQEIDCSSLRSWQTSELSDFRQYVLHSNVKDGSIKYDLGRCENSAQNRRFEATQTEQRVSETYEIGPIDCGYRVG